MNQIQIQEKVQQQRQRMLDKANFLVKNKRVRRSTVKESRNIWIVGSYSTTKRWYVVKWNEVLDRFTCACKAYEYSECGEGICLHIAACSIFEGGEAQ